MSDVIRIEGLDALDRTWRVIDDDLRRELQKEMQDAARIVSEDARSRLSRYNARSAMGIRARIERRTMAVVEQRRARTTGKRGDWGALQMRKALVPARAVRRSEVIARLDRMLGRLAGEHGF